MKSACKCGHNHQVSAIGNICLELDCPCTEFRPVGNTATKPAIRKWTVERVKAELPNVVVLFNGVHHDAELAGSRCDYPLLIIPAVLDGQLIPHSFVGDWQEIADSLNANLPLDILP